MGFDDTTSESHLLLEEIKSLTATISCDKVHGLGNITEIHHLLQQFNLDNLDITALVNFASIAEEFNLVIQEYMKMENFQQAKLIFNDLTPIRDSLLTIELMLDKYMILNNRIQNKERRLHLLLDNISSTIEMVNYSIDNMTQPEIQILDEVDIIKGKIYQTQTTLSTICKPRGTFSVCMERLQVI